MHKRETKTDRGDSQERIEPTTPGSINQKSLGETMSSPACAQVAPSPSTRGRLKKATVSRRGELVIYAATVLQIGKSASDHFCLIYHWRSR